MIGIFISHARTHCPWRHYVHQALIVAGSGVTDLYDVDTGTTSGDVTAAGRLGGVGVPLTTGTASALSGGKWSQNGRLRRLSLATN